MALRRSVGLLRASDTALFLCDMQEKFRPSIQFFDEIVAMSNRLLNGSQILSMPVVVTEQYPKGLGSTVSELGLSAFPAIRPVSKTQFSMLTHEVSDRMAKEFPDVKSVLLCGIEAHVCVQGTCLDLLHRGFEVHVIADAVSSRTQSDRLMAIDRMRDAGAFVTTTESALLTLAADSSSPLFRPIQKLIMQILVLQAIDRSVALYKKKCMN